MAMISRNTVFWFMNDFGRCAHPKSLFWRSKTCSAVQVIADETVREVLLSKCGARTIPEFQLHTKDRQKDIVRDVMRELGAGPRQMVRVCGLTYAVVYKMWKDL